MISVRLYKLSDRKAWDQYVENHRNGILYHLSGWKNVIEKTYGHKTYYLLAEDSNEYDFCHIVGILPIVHLKHFLFGNSLISIPFFDMAGVLADNDEVAKNLILKAVEIAREIKADVIELRHVEYMPIMETLDERRQTDFDQSVQACETKSHKVRMVLGLPDTSEALWNSFRSKHRNKIKKPINEGLETILGGTELLADFYHIFCINMRDLGSPVHSQDFIKNVLDEFPQVAKIMMAYQGSKALACGFLIGFKNVMENPWSSFQREYSEIRPNYLLYWSMLEYACDHGYAYFDFGRSSPDEGTYRFKVQWGANPEPLYWHYILLNSKLRIDHLTEKSRFETLISLWKQLPVSITKIMGPKIRKHIGL